uniref:Potassium channel domain-containing protein n=1 Tax=Ditylenchus dipsaci TaxID=166011 RepID=A0A915DZE7_9BILA
MNAADRWKRSQRSRENTIFGFGSSTSGNSTARSQLDSIQSYKQEERDRQEESGDEVGMLAQPGFWTKTFVLSLLFFYMATMALIFSVVQDNWNFLDSFYFCLITLVTIGFGDFCPVEEDHYGGWIIFIFAGLILSTLTVDLVGSAYIERIHTLGRGFDLGSFLNMLGKGNTATLLQQLYAGSYQPADLKFIPYIDQVNNANYLRNNSSSATSSLAMITMGYKKESISLEVWQQQMQQRQLKKASFNQRSSMECTA